MSRARRCVRTGLWLLTLAVPLTLILFDWWTDHALGLSVADEGRSASSALSEARQVVWAGSDDPARFESAGPKPGTVVLTFDDGPDPTSTPKILDVLAKYDVSATFFVIGDRVVDHPDLVRRIWREGHEVANHTYTHPDLASMPQWRQRLELSLTDTVIVGAIGRSAATYRLPYSSSPSAATPGEVELIRHFSPDRAAVFSDDTGRDYLAQSADEILDDVRDLDPAHGQILLLHDGGGDRAATVEALDQIIPLLQAKGMQFVGLGESLGADRDAVNPPTSTAQRWTGIVALKTLGFASTLRQVFTVCAWILLAWAVLKILLDLVFLLLHRRRLRRRVIDLDFNPTVSVIVPAYNESAAIADALRTIASSQYPLTEIIVVDDGSTDDTADVAAATGIDVVRVVRQANGGKAAALNRGIQEALGTIIVCVDADTVFQSDTITWIVQPFVDGNVGAVSGNVKVGNRKSLLGKWQHVEYTYGQRAERSGQELLGVTWCIPGAIGAFRRSALIAGGGFDIDTLAEDTDTAVRVYLDGWRSVFEPRSIAWTEVPTTAKTFWKQRMRWHFGNYQVLWKQRSQLVRRPRRFGLLMMPYSFLSLVAMPLVLPMIDIVALVQVATTGPGTVVYIWLLLALLTTASAVVAMRMSGERLRTLVHLPVQQFVYRWVYIALSLKALRMALSGSLVAWNKPARLGQAGDALHATNSKRDQPDALAHSTRVEAADAVSVMVAGLDLTVHDDNNEVMA